MASYPKQLQLYSSTSVAGAGDIKAGNRALGDTPIYSDGFTPPIDVTVNGVLAVISDTLYGIDLTGITNNIRTRPRFQEFDTTFGDVVVYTGGVAVTGGKTTNEMITDLRTAWDTYTLRGTRQTGLASSVDS